MSSMVQRVIFGAPIAAALALALHCGPDAKSLQNGPPPGPDPSFGESHLWDDGKAELSLYDAEEIVEGEKRSFEATSIVVAELFDPDQMVKKEPWNASYVPLLKCNWFLTIPTGVYRYQQMASLFLRRSDLLAMKAAFSSQEWCGLTFAEWRRDQPGLHIHSYWDGEADQTYELAPFAEATLFYEEVPLWIRGRRPDHPRTEKLQLIEKRLATSKCPPPKIVSAQLVFKGLQGDAAKKTCEIDLTREGATDSYSLAPDFPHALLEWRRSDGTKWKLKKTSRLDYWKFNKNDSADVLHGK